MNIEFNIPRRWLIAGIVILLLAAVTTLVSAQTSTTIHSCVNPSTGAIIIQSAWKKCSSPYSQTLDWKTGGVAGASGPSGPSGPSGAQGAQGVVGPTGPQGMTGETGPQGPTGGTGPAGATGVQGITGEQGPTGPTGSMGPSGSVGLKGVTGATGEDNFTAGPTGPSGPSGSSGPSGAPGTASGPSGPQGPNGPQGTSGPSGPTGTSGASGPSGPTGSPAALGHNTNGASSGSSNVDCTIGEITLYAGTVTNGQKADGSTLSISANSALYSLLGCTYGCPNASTFKIPNLQSVAPNGMTYAICTVGFFPSNN